MVSKDPFRFASSPAVAPIPCMACGNNMRCVRRQPAADCERQLFVCASCGHSSERMAGVEESDDEIQSGIERSLGIVRKAG